MPNLPAATDPVRMAGVLLGLQDETADILSVFATPEHRHGAIRP